MADDKGSVWEIDGGFIDGKGMAVFQKGAVAGSSTAMDGHGLFVIGRQGVKWVIAFLGYIMAVITGIELKADAL